MQEGAQEGLPDWLRSFTASQEGGHPKRLPRRGPSPGTSTTRRPQVLEAAGVSPELRALLTTDHMEARLHAVPLAWVRQDKMAAQLRHYRGRFDTSEREPPRWARLGGRRLARLGLRVGCPRSPHTRLHCLHLAVLLRRRLPLQPRRWRPPVPLPPSCQSSALRPAAGSTRRTRAPPRPGEGGGRRAQSSPTRQV